MLDLNFVRANLELVEENLRARGQDPETQLSGFRDLDGIRKGRITRLETLQAERNRLSEEVAKKKRQGEDATDLIAKTRDLRSEMEVMEKSAAEAEEALRAILIRQPNLLHSSVPPGKGERENVEVARWGTQPHFDFAPKPHWELGAALG